MLRYALITVARNEEAYIQGLIDSVICQKVLPCKWVIVNDGSTDRTRDIVASYLDKFPFMELLSLDRNGPRDFSIKAWATTYAATHMDALDIAVIGMIDADVVIPPGFSERVIREFQRNPKLGISGAILLEERHGKFTRKSGMLSEFVSGGTQFWRWECFKQIGGYMPLACGGEDTVTDQMAGLSGWDVYPTPGLVANHRRHSGSVGTPAWKTHFRDGVREHLLGYHPIFEFLKCVTHALDHPVLLGSICRMAGYLSSSTETKGIAVPQQIRQTIRSRQLQTLRMLAFKRKLEHWMNWNHKQDESA